MCCVVTTILRSLFFGWYTFNVDLAQWFPKFAPRIIGGSPIPIQTNIYFVFRGAIIYFRWKSLEPLFKRILYSHRHFLCVPLWKERSNKKNVYPMPQSFSWKFNLEFLPSSHGVGVEEAAGVVGLPGVTSPCRSELSNQRLAMRTAHLLKDSVKYCVISYKLTYQCQDLKDFLE